MTKNINFFSYYTFRARQQRHRFHIVTPSPWPLLASLSVLSLAVGGVMYFHGYVGGGATVCLALLTLLSVMGVWWRDVVRESTLLGYHTAIVSRGLRMGVMLFIISEILFFFAFFWAFFHSSISPTLDLGGVWPPIGISILNPFHIPLLNTFILLISGVTVTLSHHCVTCERTAVDLALPNNSMKVQVSSADLAVFSLLTTIVLAVEFTTWQVCEYNEALFYINDGVYGSSFYLTTGFHGFHVFVGTIFLGVALFRLVLQHFLQNHHLGFEFSIWYWHFVDVVWLFLYVFVYCWSSNIL